MRARSVGIYELIIRTWYTIPYLCVIPIVTTGHLEVYQVRILVRMPGRPDHWVSILVLSRCHLHVVCLLYATAMSVSNPTATYSYY